MRQTNIQASMGLAIDYLSDWYRPYNQVVGPNKHNIPSNFSSVWMDSIMRSDRLFGYILYYTHYTLNHLDNCM
jgi:hypothetical protein